MRSRWLCLFLCSLAALPGQETLAQLESRARELKARGDAAGSLEAWQKAAALDPKSAAIQDEIGFLLAVLNRRQEAIQHFERAVSLDPRSATPALPSRGRLLARSGSRPQHSATSGRGDARSPELRLPLPSGPRARTRPPISRRRWRNSRQPPRSKPNTRRRGISSGWHGRIRATRRVRSKPTSAR